MFLFFFFFLGGGGGAGVVTGHLEYYICVRVLKVLRGKTASKVFRVHRLGIDLTLEMH